MWCILLFSHSLQILNHTINPKGESLQHNQCDLLLEDFWKENYAFPVSWICLILLKMYRYPWIFVLGIFLSLRDVMRWICLNLSSICYNETSSMTCYYVVGYFIQMFITHTLVLFMSGNAWLHVELSIYWETYYMLWWSQ